MMSRMRLTGSSLREYQHVKNGIVNGITHGISTNTAAGFTRVAMMYLYTMWDTRSARPEWFGATKSNYEPPEMTNASLIVSNTLSRSV